MHILSIQTKTEKNLNNHESGNVTGKISHKKTIQNIQIGYVKQKSNEDEEKEENEESTLNKNITANNNDKKEQNTNNRNVTIIEKDLNKATKYNINTTQFGNETTTSKIFSSSFRTTIK